MIFHTHEPNNEAIWLTKQTFMTITLKNLNEASEQQVFDQVVNGLLSQGAKSSDVNGACRYRAVREDGRVLKCAAGWLIADDEYTSEMDDDNPTGTSWEDLFQRDMVPAKHLNFIYNLQKIHDNHPFSRYEEQFKLFAEENNLKYRPCTEAV